MKLKEACQHIYEVCVVGGGPAGIIFVFEYIKSNSDQNVIPIEFGHKGQKVNNEKSAE